MKKDLKRVQRLIKILQLIDGGNIGRHDLANKFDVSERQIYRDVESLICEAKFPIIYSKKNSTYSFLDGFSLKKISLQPSELQVLLIAKQMLYYVGEEFAANIDNFFSRLIHECKTSSLSKSPISVRMDTPVNFSEIEEIYKTFLYAIGVHEQVEIDHRGEDEEYVKRQIDPYRLFHSDGFWYAIGYCHLREDIRTFALDKIRSVTLIHRYFAIRNNFEFDCYMANCWKKFYLGEPEEMTIRFSPEVAKDIKRKKWHPSQEIKEHKDGSIDFIVTISGYDEIMKWILSWGSKAKVISPEELRKRIKQEASQIARQ